MGRSSQGHLYIHVPFCRKLCRYCDFPKGFYLPSLSKPYVERLCREIDALDGSFETVYIGGGTPSVLSLDELEALLCRLSPKLSEECEFTLEANPESLTEDKIAMLRKYGVNRVSLGAESFSPKLLSLMGREHEREDVDRAVSALRDAGISNINLDIIYGLPGETDEELLEDLQILCSYEVPHLSAYSLSVSPNTPFYSMGIQEENDELGAKHYQMVVDFLRNRGYKRYEVSNFALKGLQSRHNTAYWKDEEYIGLGLGAAGYMGGRHYQNTKSINRYLKEGPCPVYEDKQNRSGEIEYFLLTNLRLEDGFTDEEFRKRFGKTFGEEFGKKADGLVEEGLLVMDGKIHCSDRGILLLDRVLLALY